MSWAQRLFGRITELLTTASNVVSQQIRIVTRRLTSAWRQPTHDWARPDYAFWRRAYYARARGLELSGLLIKPLVNKIAGWTLGRPPEFRCQNTRSQQRLMEWWNSHHAAILRAYRAALRQGDAFVVINADLSVTVVRPDLVDPIVAEDDYSRIIGWRVTQVVEHPTRTADRLTMIDEYYPDRRVHRIERNALTVQETVYPNLLGRLPIVHIANAVDDGETFGHPEAEALVELFHRYGAIFDAALEGNQLQGRPTPVLSFATKEDLDKFWQLYGTTKTTTLPDGNTEKTTVLSVNLSQLLTVSAADFEYKSPGAFAEDTVRLLELLFYLFLEHSELPEFVLGNAIASSKASAEAQMPIFERFVELRRREIAGWLLACAEIVLGYLSLIEPGVTVETPAIQWQKLTQDGRLMLDTLTWAYAEGLIDERTALVLAPMDVEDVDEVLRKAREEREARMEQQEARAEAQFDQDLADEIENLEI